MSIFLATIEQSLLLLPLVCGMYISYRILKVTDLTMDGTYVLGAAIFARMIDLGIIFALLLSCVVGALIGAIVGLMQRDNKVSDLVVGILASFMLYSVNLQVMGKPNISLIGKASILSVTGFSNWISVLAIISILVILILFFVLKSDFGLFLRAFGHNQKLLQILGKPAEYYRMLGLSLSNALSSFAGALTAGVNCFADINMGLGVALIGIGAVVIGGHIIIKAQENFCVIKGLMSCFIGIILYFLCLNMLLMIGINPVNLKLILGLMLFFTLRSVQKNTVIS